MGSLQFYTSKCILTQVSENMTIQRDQPLDGSINDSPVLKAAMGTVYTSCLLYTSDAADE